mmetsp:Transcript_156746/g.300635  ORF Transcript_156746/g.300635 Transcript_156746/m.300635 type:complete len:1829 (-) Transcript_156746:72-5558(-)
MPQPQNANATSPIRKSAAPPSATSTSPSQSSASQAQSPQPATAASPSEKAAAPSQTASAPSPAQGSTAQPTASASSPSQGAASQKPQSTSAASPGPASQPQTANAASPGQSSAQQPPNASAAASGASAAGGQGSAASARDAHGSSSGQAQPAAKEELPSNHYEVLGLTLQASATDIKKAYHKKSFECHPDKNRGDPNATARFQRVVEAYNILSAPAKRAQYDADNILKKAYGSLGIQNDPGAATFVQRNINSRGVPQFDSLAVEARFVDAIQGQGNSGLQELKRRSGADMYIVWRRGTSLNAHILIAGTAPGVCERGKTEITSFIAELLGTKAPPDGVILLVPQGSVPLAITSQAHYRYVYDNFQCTARLTGNNDRIVLKGGRMPLGVIHIQSCIGWSATVLMPSGQHIDAWLWAHVVEASGVGYQVSGPPNQPTPATTRQLLYVGAGITEEESRGLSLSDLALRALQAYTTKGKPVTSTLTSTLMRMITSDAVFKELAALPAKAQIPLLKALVDNSAQLGTHIPQRWREMQFFRTLQAILTMFSDSSSEVGMRARVMASVKASVPEDGVWHSWESILKPETAMNTFWNELRQYYIDNKSLGIWAPPMEWLAATPIWYDIVSKTCMKAFAKGGISYDLARGLRRPQDGMKSVSGGQTDPAASAKVDESLTLVERVEDIVLHFACKEKDAATFVGLSRVTNEASKQDKEAGGLINKKWFEQHREHSFEMKKSSDDWKVKLTAAAASRAASRTYERQKESERSRELKVAEELKMSVTSKEMLVGLRPSELAALYMVLIPGAHLNQKTELTPHILRLLCKSGSASPKDILQDLSPFPAARLMKGACDFDKASKGQCNWNTEHLDKLLQAAALDMHTDGSRPRAPLPAVVEALDAAIKQPFTNRVNASRVLLIPSAALRMQLEIAEKVAMTEDSSNFVNFTQMCRLLAHLVAQVNVSEGCLDETKESFKKLADQCEALGQADGPPMDPEGLSKLAASLYLAPRHDQDRQSYVGALQGLARICVQHAMAPGAQWSTQQLARLAMAYGKLQVPSEELFKKIKSFAEKHVAQGTDWGRADFTSLNMAALQLGHLSLFEGFLYSCARGARTLQKYMRETPDEELALFFHVAVLLRDNALLEDFAKTFTDKVHAMNLQGMISMLKAWPSWEAKTSAQTACYTAIVREACKQANRTAPSLPELEVLVTAAKSKKDDEALTRISGLGSSPALLNNLPNTDMLDAGWKVKDMLSQLSAVVSTFNKKGGVVVPCLEAACGSRVLAALVKAQHSDLRDVAHTLLQFEVAHLGKLPSVVEVASKWLADCSMPKAGSSEAKIVAESIEHLVRAVKKVGAANTFGDPFLDKQVEALEHFALSDDTVRERRLDWLEQHAGKKLPEKARSDLGHGWLTLLLTRSTRLAWKGSNVVKLESPRPRAAVKKLADAARTILSASVCAEAAALVAEKVEEHPRPAAQRGADASRKSGSTGGSPSSAGAGATPARPKAPPPGSLVVSGGWDKEMAETLQGTYAPSSENHGRKVYKRDGLKSDETVQSIVLLYYWDERDGPDQCGWWFGPEIGGEEVWCYHNGKADEKLPPEKGWTVLHSGAVDLGLSVQPFVEEQEKDRQRRDEPQRRQGREEAPAKKQKLPAAPPRDQTAIPRPAAQQAAPNRRDAAAPPKREELPPPRPVGMQQRGDTGKQQQQAPPKREEPPAPRPAAPAQREQQPPPRPAAPAAPRPAAPAAPAAGAAKRTRQDNQRATELRAWLEGLDDGAGALLQYYDILEAEFDADLSMIAAAKVPQPDGGEKRGVLSVVDPSFWETVKVQKTGHKMLFARGIAKL